jgi:hypothetical protein
MSQGKPELPEIPEEFKKIIPDFVTDLLNTFPEYQAIIDRWWKLHEYEHVADEIVRQQKIEEEKADKLRILFDYCIQIYPERFFDILYQNQDIFKQDSIVNTEFLPGVSFKYLWSCDISDKTKETLWKYLQLILLSIISCVKDRGALGDTAKLFETVNEDDFKTKLQETLEKMQTLFDDSGDTSGEEGKPKMPNGMPSADDIHGHISSMLDSKLGNLAREIAEETVHDMDMDFENVTDVKDVFQKMFKNPGKLMNLVKNVGEKLDTKMKSGEINQSELMQEATNIMGKMKDMPGMDNIQDMLSKMGGMGGLAGMMGGLGKNMKVDVNAMQAQLDRNNKMQAMKNRMKKKVVEKQMAAAMAAASQNIQANQSTNTMTEEELIAMFSEKPEKTPIVQKKEGAKKKKNKNKK